MSKTVDKVMCDSCESEFKITYDTAETSGFPKFCPFCASDLETKEEKDDFYTKDDE